MSPVCLDWLTLVKAVAVLAIPCGPASSCHPRSRVRVDRSREEKKEEAVRRECAISL